MGSGVSLLRNAACAGHILTRLSSALATAGALMLYALLALMGVSGSASAKTPGGVHCHGKTCHRVSSLEEMDGIVGRTGLLKVSYYDDCHVDRYNACGLTSSGAVFRTDLPDNAASPIFPDGTILLAFNPENKRAVVLRVNSAGPYWGDRKLDISRAAAEKLGFKRRGVAELMVAILKSPDSHEARFKKLRQYDRVPGYIGKFPDFHAAHAKAISALALELQAAPLRVADASSALPQPPPIPRPSNEELFKHAVNFLDSVAASEINAIAASLETVHDAGLAWDAPSHTSDSHRVLDESVAPLEDVPAYEPDYSWLGLRQRLEVFRNQAVYRARAPALPLTLPPKDEWSEKIARFVGHARQQAREGVARRGGGLYDLFASLRDKAQPQRRMAP